MSAAGTYRLELEPQKTNIFVTQLREEDEEEDRDIRKFPIVKETSGKLLETGLNTLQSTLLLKKEVEVEKVQENLDIKRKQFAERMETCRAKEEELKKKQMQIRERVGKFEKFIQENDAKRRRAIQKYQTELKLKEAKKAESDILANELDTLRSKKMALESKLAKYSIYEKYLLRVLDRLPEDYLEMSDSMLMGVMMRFRTLSSTNQTLVQMLSDKADQLEKEQQQLQDMNLEHTQCLLLKNSKLATLQEQLEDAIQRNAKLDQQLIDRKATFRQQSETLGQIKLAIDNISEKCIRRHATPLDSQDFDGKLKVIEEHIIEHSDICRLAKPPESVTTSTEAGLNSPSILKKDSRLSRLNSRSFGESPMKGSSSRGFRNVHMALRFAANVK